MTCNTLFCRAHPVGGRSADFLNSPFTHICLGKAGSIIHPVRAGFAVLLPLLKTENSVLLDGTRALQSEGETVLSRQRVIAIDAVKKEKRRITARNHPRGSKHGLPATFSSPIGRISASSMPAAAGSSSWLYADAHFQKCHSLLKGRARTVNGVSAQGISPNK